MGNVWQVSRWQPWVEPVGTFSSSCYRGRRVPWAACFTLFFLKVFLCLPAGYCVFCPPPPPAPWHLLRTKPQVLNILSCLNLPSVGFLSLSQHGWLPLAFFFFFFKSLKSNFTPSLHSYAKPLWGSSLETFALISVLLFLKSGNMIFSSSVPGTSASRIQEQRPDSKPKSCWSLSEGFRHQILSHSKPVLGLTCLVSWRRLPSGFPVPPSKPLGLLINLVITVSIPLPQPACAVCQSWQNLP